MGPMSVTPTTNPTPSVLALGTSHIWATSILLNGCLAFGALMGSNLVNPVLVKLFLSLST